MKRLYPTVKALALVPVLTLALAGCASIGGAGRAVGAGAPATELNRDALLSVIADCHLLRVGQTVDVEVTDASVIAALDKYGIEMEEVVARSNQRVRGYLAKRAPGDEFVRQTSEACQRLSLLTGVAPALVRFEPTGRLRTTWLRVDGAEITDGFAERTIAALRKTKAVGLVINSPGGSVFEARRLGRYLRSNGLRSAVDGACTSACIDVLAGGAERYATRRARLGIHQSKVPTEYSSHEGGQLYVADSFRYLREMGVDADVAIVAATVPNDKILLIPLRDALETGLVTAVVDSL